MIFLAFSPTFIILTISYEGLFYVTFFTTLVLWSELETKVALAAETPVTLANGLANGNGHAVPVAALRSFRKLALSDARIALFFFVLLQTGFFATGNIASVSSFSLESVYRLVPLFDPFLMAALLIFKLLVPFAGNQPSPDLSDNTPHPLTCLAKRFSDFGEFGDFESKVTCPAFVTVYDRPHDFGYHDAQFLLPCP
jgi:Phosphatidylinositolglycan class N (PIG-N)